MMLLIGQFISPFVRRVGITMTLLGLPYTHRAWSTFADVEKIRPFNPALRVPVLVLDNGVALSDSHLILEYLDGCAPQGDSFVPAAESQPESLRLRGLANALADMAVAMVYEMRRHDPVPEEWRVRCLQQMDGALEAIETAVRARDEEFLFGRRIGHADIAVATAFRFATDAHGDSLALARCATLSDYCARLEATPAFQACVHEHMVPVN